GKSVPHSLISTATTALVSPFHLFGAFLVADASSIGDSTPIASSDSTPKPVSSLHSVTTGTGTEAVTACATESREPEPVDAHWPAFEDKVQVLHAANAADRDALLLVK